MKFSQDSLNFSDATYGEECVCDTNNALFSPKSYSWNVIDDNTFKEKIRIVFDMVANALSKTLGPYGSTTIIEKFGEMHITKDGWQVLKSIRFDDFVCNNILMLLLRISAQVVIKVGDGSTSSIVAANSFLRELDAQTDAFKHIRPKEFMALMNSCVKIIVDEIYSNAHSIDRSGTFQEIYDLAYVSTNGDSEIAKMIKELYVETGNPAIEYLKSKTEKTYFEIINGYTSNITYIDNIFVTNDDGECVVSNPLILMFDHKADVETSLPIISAAAMKAAEQNTRLVVVAPAYDKFLLDNIRKNVVIEYKSKGTSTVVYTRATLVNNISHDMYNDFAVLAGAQVISEQWAEEVNETNITDFLGAVSEINIGEKTTLIRGFEKRNDNMYQKIIEDATNKYNAMFEENESRGIVDPKLNELKQRMMKLKCSMGVIYVGGNTTLEKTANYDLVEDAVKACESAFNHGYNCGGNLIIPYVVNQILKDRINISADEYAMFSMIKNAFINVYETVLMNKFKTDDNTIDIDEFVNKSLADDMFAPICYDLVTDRFSDKIINSCETDIEILRATSSIISLLISSNQYISINTETPN
jgi:chaperonin GroEL